MVKRGQGAMEYLMTYGWAILVIVIVLAALLYLGVFNVGERVPEQCNFKVGILCLSSKISSTGGTGVVALTLRNGLGNKITVCNVICNDQYTGIDQAELSDLVSACTALDTIDVGQQKTITQAGAGCVDLDGTDVPVGIRYRGKIFIQYYEQGDSTSSNQRVSQGELQAVIQP